MNAPGDAAPQLWEPSLNLLLRPQQHNSPRAFLLRWFWVTDLLRIAGWLNKARAPQQCLRLHPDLHLCHISKYRKPASKPLRAMRLQAHSSIYLTPAGLVHEGGALAKDCSSPLGNFLPNCRHHGLPGGPCPLKGLKGIFTATNSTARGLTALGETEPSERDERQKQLSHGPDNTA